MLKDYPRYLSPGFKPYDPLVLAKETEEIVCRGDAKKYTKFYCVGVYGGISTAYTVGCDLRCIFCWVEWSRDFPEQHGNFYTPQQVFQRLVFNAGKKKVSKLRISGGEPTLGKEHLLKVLDLINTTRYSFILETNGILFGADKEYVKSLQKYKNVYIRLCLKAGTPEGFQRRTGAKGDFFELPFKGIENLMDARLKFHVACMNDPAVMPKDENKAMLKKLKELNYQDYLEEEMCDPYFTSVKRLEKAGYQIFERRGR
jgi:uncharacterized Fe-S cluster-containing radical SAM superfamily protein